MTRPMIRINDGTEIIDREMNEQEYAHWQESQLAVQARMEAEAVAEAAKEAAQIKLTALGLTTDDLKALGLGTN